MESESNEVVSNIAYPLNNFPSPSNVSGTRTPPMYTTAVSVPFRWEEEPGKPRPCTALIAFPTATANKYLELQLPPRLLHLSDSKITSSSPTTVLNEGPYMAAGGNNTNMIIQSLSNSMRFKKKKSSSFGIGSPDYEISSSSSRGLLGDMVLIKNRGKGKSGFFSSWPVVAGKKKSTQKLDDDDNVDLSFSKEDEIMKMRRNGSFISTHVQPSSSSFLASLCQGIKHVIPLKMISRTRTVKKKNPNRFIITPPT